MLKSHFFLIKTCFHTSCRLNSKPGKVLNKIMYGTKKKKHHVIHTAPIIPSVSGPKPIDAKITGNPRRSNMLNKLFMKYVTDIMSHGEYSSELLGYGIEVNKVKISSDFRILNVFWVAKEMHKSEEVDKLLQKNAGHLAHELSGLMLMGKVPTIMFVKDKHYNKIKEVQEKLAEADFGDDFEPTEIAEKYKSELSMLLTSFDSELKEKIKKIDTNEEEEQDDDFPPMPHNVLGLDHAQILKKIKKGMDTSKAPHRVNPEAADWAKWSQFKSTQPVNPDPVEFASLQQQRQVFRNFLRQRQILLTKQQRLENKNWSPDKECLIEESQDLYPEDQKEEQDFILEEDGKDVK